MPADGTITHTIVANAARAGIGAFGARFSVQGARVSCASFDLDLESFGAAAGEMDDRGDNYCGCGESLRRCTAQSANLAVLGAPEP